MVLGAGDTSHHFDRYKMLLRLQVGTAIGCAFILLYCLQYIGSGFLGIGGALRIAAVGVLAAGASLFLGFVLGFVFCIPRTAKPAAAAQASSSGADAKETVETGTQSRAVAFSAIETNTNLVDISDWLTKILVGVGLVELNKIPYALQKLAEFLGPGLRECDSVACVGSSEAFALGIVVFFFGAGFLIGYLWTRLYFQRALSELADQADRREKAWLAATGAEVLMNDGQLDEALRMVDEALEFNPANAKALFIKGRILKKLAQLDGKPGDRALLQEALENATKAAVLLPNKGGPLYNMACYQALLGVGRTEVLKNLKRAIQLNPILKDEARKDEDLLASLKEDADFKELTREDRPSEQG